MFGLTWWVDCIPFDVARGIGNFVMDLILFVSLRELMTRLLKQF